MLLATALHPGRSIPSRASVDRASATLHRTGDQPDRRVVAAEYPQRCQRQRGVEAIDREQCIADHEQHGTDGGATGRHGERIPGPRMLPGAPQRPGRPCWPAPAHRPPRARATQAPIRTTAWPAVRRREGAGEHRQRSRGKTAVVQPGREKTPVRQQEHRQARHEQITGQHQQHVAAQGAPQAGQHAAAIAHRQRRHRRRPASSAISAVASGLHSQCSQRPGPGGSACISNAPSDGPDRREGDRRGHPRHRRAPHDGRTGRHSSRRPARAYRPIIAPPRAAASGGDAIRTAPSRSGSWRAARRPAGSGRYRRDR